MINEYGNESPNFIDPTLDPNAIVNTEILTNDDVISILNGLIETCKDGQEGFKQSAEGITDSEIKSAFYQFGQQRSQFAGELQGLVRELGGDPEKSGTVLGSLHRGWIDIKSILTGKDEAAILNEAERGEDVAKNNYQEALEKNLPANIRSVIETQYYSVKESHDRVKIMRNVAINTKTAKQSN